MTRAVSRAVELRLEFDRSFASAPTAEVGSKQDLLAIRLGENNFAMRLSEISGLFVDKKIIRVPGASAAMLGIAGFRGSIVPVYDLQRLLGYSSQTSRWMVVAAAAPVAFIFQQNDGLFRVPPDALTQAQGQHDFTNDFVQIQGALRPIIQLSSVLEAIKS
jgi:purine-binding chemotaxis protein CheW